MPEGAEQPALGFVDRVALAQIGEQRLLQQVLGVLLGNPEAHEDGAEPRIELPQQVLEGPVLSRLAFH